MKLEVVDIVSCLVIHLFSPDSLGKSNHSTREGKQACVAREYIKSR